MKNVAIIGGGISGLISIKCCLEAGLNPTCFEMTTDIGGLWNFDQNAVEGKASVMKSTVINTSKEFMAFSDFPPPEEFPNFMHNRKLLEYFRMYADRFQLVQYVRFSRRVTRIEPDENYEQKGSWKIVSIDAKSSNEENPTIETFDAVLLATGHHATPKSIDFPGLKQFKGQIMHSWEYKKPTGFEDKNVLVVGIGNSGGDVVVELSRIAKQVYLSTRRGTWVLNRVGPNGWPSDMALVGEVTAFLQRNFPRLTNWFMERQCNKKFDHETYGIKPNHSLIGQHPFINDDLPNRIICGSAIVKPNIKKFTSDGRGVIFEDNTRIDDLDCVILATGYNISFPYISNDLISVENNQVRLYKYVWPAHLKHSTLAVIGLIQPWGAINPISELQARWAARVFKGELNLPNAQSMNEDIDKKIELMSKRYVNTVRHTVQVDHVDFCNEIAEQVGCRPNLFQFFIKDFLLGFRLIFGPCTPYRYRLEGPNRWEGARHAILTQDERVEFTLRQGRNMRRMGEHSSRNYFSFNLKTMIFLTVIFYFVFRIFMFFLN